MDKQFSRYLDMLRVVAAMLVLVAHLADPVFTDGAITVPSQLGYSAVMFFFVLSGYVISYVAVEREFTLRDFSISRIARIYSVVIPAIALTIFVDVLFLSISPFVNATEFMEGIPVYQYEKFPKYIFMTIFFGNQLLGLRENAFSNSVYWSMCFEVYYYVIFAAAFYLRGARRLIVLTGVLLIVGPGPLLRFPLWLFGCAVYWLHRNHKMPAIKARFIFVVTTALIVFYLASDFNLWIDDQLDLRTNGWVGHGPFRRVIGDTLTGFTVALNILAARDAGFYFGRVGASFTYLASFSFSLYLMHAPLLRLWSAYWHPGPVTVVILVLASVWLLGHITEKQKDHLRDVLRRLWVPRAVSRNPAVASHGTRLD